MRFTVTVLIVAAALAVPALAVGVATSKTSNEAARWHAPPLKQLPVFHRFALADSHGQFQQEKYLHMSVDGFNHRRPEACADVSSGRGIDWRKVGGSIPQTGRGEFRALRHELLVRADAPRSKANEWRNPTGSLSSLVHMQKVAPFIGVRAAAKRTAAFLPKPIVPFHSSFDHNPLARVPVSAFVQPNYIPFPSLGYPSSYRKSEKNLAEAPKSSEAMSVPCIFCLENCLSTPNSKSLVKNIGFTPLRRTAVRPPDARNKLCTIVRSL